MSLPLIIAIAVVVLLAIWLVVTRNSMIAARNRVDEAWSGIDVQLKRRRDLIPNLVETVKGYATHEQRVFTDVTEARAAADRATGVRETQQAERRLSESLLQVRAVAESYPSLRASENFQALQAELADTEDQIQASRRIYNSNVRDYNTKIQVFPSALVAASTGFKPREFFEIDAPSEREPVQVSFS